MSEFARPHSKDEAPIENTLFTDDMLETMTDQDSSVEETRRQLGIKAPEKIEIIENPQPGVSIDLGQRAVHVRKIMEYHNHDSKLSGAKLVRGISDNSFDRSYRAQGKNPNAVFAGMEEKNDLLYDQYKSSIEALNATDRMKKAGFDEESVNATRRVLQRQSSNYQAGVSNPREREKEAKKVQKTADIATKPAETKEKVA